MHFFYDAQSRPSMLEYGGEIYTYLHNLQGDIIGIVDSAGSVVVRYGYDAWGKPTEVWTEDAPALESSLKTAYEKLAKMNPFRYRGYVWDAEIGLYYLRSRYYNPGWGRFINEDSTIMHVMMGKNIFCYCLNNPIMSVDNDGVSSDPFHDAVQLAVQTHIIGTSPIGGIEMNTPVYDLPLVNWRKTDEGQLDLFNRNTGEIWEIKKATERPSIFDRQLARYLDGKVEGFNGTLIPGGYIPSATISFGDDMKIYYYSTAPGLIAYEVYKEIDGQKVLVPVPSPERERNLEKNRERARAYGAPSPGFAVDVDWKRAGKAIGIGIVIVVGYYSGGCLGALFSLATRVAAA